MEEKIQNISKCYIIGVTFLSDKKTRKYLLQIKCPVIISLKWFNNCSSPSPNNSFIITKCNFLQLALVGYSKHARTTL